MPTSTSNDALDLVAYKEFKADAVTFLVFFVMVPGTSDIDWQQTYAAREKFLNTQAPLIRR